MKLQSIPDCISICGIKFKIEQVSCVNKGDGGYTLGKIDFSTDVIQLDADLPEDKKLQVLIHEILHAVFDLTGNQEIGDDEKTVHGRRHQRRSSKVIMHSIFMRTATAHLLLHSTKHSSMPMIMFMIQINIWRCITMQMGQRQMLRSGRSDDRSTLT